MIYALSEARALKPVNWIVHECNDIARTHRAQPLWCGYIRLRNEETHMSNVKNRTAAIVRAIMQRNDWSAAQAARAIGVAPSTLTRILDDSVPFSPSSSTLQKIAQYTVRISDEAIDGLWDRTDLVTRQISSNALALGDPLPIAGLIEWGAWRDSLKHEPVTGRTVSIVDSSWQGKSVLAYEIADDRSDPIYKRGTVLIVGTSKDEPRYLEDILLCKRRVEFYGSSKFEFSLWEYRSNDRGGSTLHCRAITSDGDDDSLSGMEDARSYRFEEIGIVLAAYQSREARVSKPTPLRTPFDG